MRRVRRTRHLALALAAFALVSCSQPLVPAATPTTQAATLRLYATTPTLPLITDLTSVYSRLNANISFEVASGNFETMLNRLLAGEVPYFLSNHLPPDDQQPAPLWAAPVAQDGLAVLVNPRNSLTELSITQVRGLFGGWTRQWSDVGGLISGEDETVIPLSREAGSGTRVEFEGLVMGDRVTTPSALVMPSSTAMVERVAREPASIGYSSFSTLNNGVRALTIDGIEPTLANVANNTYPLRSFVYVIGLREPDGSQPLDLDYRAFIAWTQSPDGQAVVGQRYAPLSGD